MRTQSIAKGRFTVIRDFELAAPGSCVAIVPVTEQADGGRKTSIRRGTRLFASALDALDDAALQGRRIAAKPAMPGIMGWPFRNNGRDVHKPISSGAKPAFEPM
ncbi:hypothetical protein [Caballeronia cordobensis]|uniref:hypothetical protein n=1 Tax=Caballeronia cordobensis TaxID=1353886 RepID=UPI0006AD7CD0|nr:hypothetical protein [Caballeronia cordobensis]